MNAAEDRAIELAKDLGRDLPHRYVPPSEGTRPRSEMILPHSLVRGTRGYVERITYQVNGCYEYGWYDACAVMMRRLMETLIIEAFAPRGRREDQERGERIPPARRPCRSDPE
jgi:hypothetical protein